MVKIYQLDAYGGVPAFAERESPQPQAGEVLIRIAACGLNFADLLTIEGTYQDRPTPPVVLGKEFSGTVEAAGKGVTLRPGSAAFHLGGAFTLFTGECTVPTRAALPPASRWSRRSLRPGVRWLSCGRTRSSPESMK